MAKIDEKGTSITAYAENDMDFISLTDMLKAQESQALRLSMALERDRHAND